MKKILFATTAIVAAGLTTSANAAEWETGVSGYYFLGLALSDSDDQDGLGVLRDGEFHVNGSLTADNGLVFAARVEVESFTSGDQIDENWGAVRGSFGRIKIGGDDDAAYNYQVGTIYAPGARIGYYDAFTLTTAAGNAFSAPGRSALAPSRGSDQLAIHYDSPNFMGFQVGATYAPNGNSDGGADSNNPVFENEPSAPGDQFYSIGANYQGDFGDFGFGISGGYGNADGPSNEFWNVGANVSFAGFTLAGMFEDQEDVGEEFAIGAQYATGPWTVAGGYSTTVSTPGLPEGEIAAGWVTYALAPGVLMTAGVEYADDGVDEDFGGLAFMTLRF